MVRFSAKRRSPAKDIAEHVCSWGSGQRVEVFCCDANALGRTILHICSHLIECQRAKQLHTLRCWSPRLAQLLGNGVKDKGGTILVYRSKELTGGEASGSQPACSHELAITMPLDASMLLTRHVADK